MMFRIKGSILIGIFVTSIISWPRSTPVTYFPNTTTGDQLFDFFKQVVTWHPLQHTGNALDVRMFPLLRVANIDKGILV
jgi:AGZA family xanthine/uracil permease-like MFS transporter